MKYLISHNYRKAGFIGAFFALTCVFATGLSAAEIRNYVQNGSFADYFYNGAEKSVSLENLGFLKSSPVEGSVYDGSAGSADPNTYIANWKYVAGLNAATLGGGFGYNGSTLTGTSNNRLFVGGSTVLPADPVAFLKCGGTLSTELTGLTVGEKYTLSYKYAGRTDTGYGEIQSYISDGTNTTILQPNQLAPYNQKGFVDFIYEFTATAATMEFGFQNAISGNDRTTMMSNVSVQKSSDLTDGRWRGPTAWLNDATSGVVKGGAYTQAINFGGGDSPELNGVKFMALTGANALAGFENVSSGNPHTGMGTPNVDAASAAILSTFTTNGASFDFTGLIPGFEYETLIMGSSFGASNRVGQFSINGTTPVLFNEYGAVGATAEGFSGKEGLTIAWQGKADANGVISVKYNDISGDTWHVYGMANRALVGSEVIMATGFGGLNGAYRGKSPLGTPMDHANVFTGVSNTWGARGQAYDSGHLFVDNNGILNSGGNTGAAMGFDAEALTHFDTIIISADIKTGTLLGTDYVNARGVGIGFFSSVYGTGNGEVNRGFSGLVVSPDGELYFRSNMSNNDAGGMTSAVIPYLGSELFNHDAFYHLSMEVRLNDDDTATLISLLFGDETNKADYSPLIGTVFETTDLIGFLTSSAASLERFGYIDNFQVTGVVPEPATWVILLLGLAGGAMIFRRRKTANG